MALTDVANSLELKNAIEELAANDRAFVEHYRHLVSLLKDCYLPSFGNWAGQTGGASKILAPELLPHAVRVAEGRAAGCVLSLDSKGWATFAAHLIALDALLRNGDPLKASRRLADAAAADNDSFHYSMFQREKRDAEAKGEPLPTLQDVPRQDLKDEVGNLKDVAYFEAHLDAARETVAKMIDVLDDCVGNLKKPHEVRELKDTLVFPPHYTPKAERKEAERKNRAKEAEDDWLA